MCVCVFIIGVLLLEKRQLIDDGFVVLYNKEEEEEDEEEDEEDEEEEGEEDGEEKLLTLKAFGPSRR